MRIFVSYYCAGKTDSDPEEKKIVIFTSDEPRPAPDAEYVEDIDEWDDLDDPDDDF